MREGSEKRVGETTTSSWARVPDRDGHQTSLTGRSIINPMQTGFNSELPLFAMTSLTFVSSAPSDTMWRTRTH